jgi:hypothetical protein
MALELANRSRLRPVRVRAHARVRETALDL